MQRRSVLFPLPLGPTSAATCPFCTSRDAPSRMRRSPWYFTMLETRIIGAHLRRCPSVLVGQAAGLSHRRQASGLSYKSERGSSVRTSDAAHPPFEEPCEQRQRVAHEQVECGGEEREFHDQI